MTEQSEDEVVLTEGQSQPTARQMVIPVSDDHFKDVSTLTTVGATMKAPYCLQGIDENQETVSDGGTDGEEE